MKLSIFVPTRNGSTRNPPGAFAQLLGRLRELADELVVEVDDRTTDDTFDVAKQFTEHVHAFRPDPMFVEVHRLSFYRCSGDWIFLFDDDDVLGERWTRTAVEQLMRQRTVTHYWVPARFVVPGGRYITTAPYVGHFHLLLHRNIESLMAMPSKLHQQPAFAGEPAYIAGMFVNAMDFAWHDRSFREEKVRTYDESFDEDTPFDQRRFYLYEDYYYETGPIGDSAPVKMMSPVESGGGTGIRVRFLECPEKMTAGQTYWVTVRITNESASPLLPQSELIRWGSLALGYRWPGEPVAPLRTPFPARIMPAHEHDALVQVKAPAAPGPYRLQVEIIENDRSLSDARFETRAVDVAPLVWPPRAQ